MKKLGPSPQPLQEEQPPVGRFSVSPDVKKGGNSRSSKIPKPVGKDATGK